MRIERFLYKKSHKITLSDNLLFYLEIQNTIKQCNVYTKKNIFLILSIINLFNVIIEHNIYLLEVVV